MIDAIGPRKRVTSDPTITISTRLMLTADHSSTKRP